MCDTCGCNITPGNESLIKAGGKLQKTESGKEAVTVLHSLLHENDHTAKHNRDHFDANNVLAINLMSSPGAGKTSLLEATIEQLNHDSNENQLRIAVIEGDLETENDAERIRGPANVDFVVVAGVDRRLVQRNSCLRLDGAGAVDSAKLMLLK